MIFPGLLPTASVFYTRLYIRYILHAVSLLTKQQFDAVFKVDAEASTNGFGAQLFLPVDLREI